MQNGVKNLKGVRLFPKTLFNNGNGDADLTFPRLTVFSFYAIIFKLKNTT
jgi:hypothetical protein